MGLWTRIRQNLFLKIVSLVAAIVLYIFVQQERNPTISRTLITTVDYKNRQEGYQVVPDAPRITVSVTGPRPSVERMKDGDIKATADLSGLSTNQPSAPVRVTYDLPKNIPDIMLDGPPEFIKIQVFREKTRRLGVTPIYKHESPAGLKYGEPNIHPSQVTVRGREDFVNRIDKIVAITSPTEPQASIDGDFSLVAWDSDHNVVEGVDIQPDKVHVTIPQVLLPSEQACIVSAIFSDRPADPYYIADTIYMPNQVKVIGSPQRVASIRGIYTETLSVHDLTRTTTIDANLIRPPDVEVVDLRGKPISRVKVTVVIARKTPEPPPIGNNPPQPTAPKHDGAVGQ